MRLQEISTEQLKAWYTRIHKHMHRRALFVTSLLFFVGALALAIGLMGSVVPFPDKQVRAIFILSAAIGAVLMLMAPHFRNSMMARSPALAVAQILGRGKNESRDSQGDTTHEHWVLADVTEACELTESGLGRALPLGQQRMSCYYSVHSAPDDRPVIFLITGNGTVMDWVTPE